MWYYVNKLTRIEVVFHETGNIINDTMLLLKRI